MDTYCKNLGINISSILDNDPPNVSELTNGSVIEIFSFCQSCKIDINKITQIVSKITNTDVESKACLTKFYRLIRSDKEKRGNVKEQYRQQTFSLPTETASSNTSQQKTDAKDGGIQLDKAKHLQIKLVERRQKVEQFRKQATKKETEKKRVSTASQECRRQRDRKKTIKNSQKLNKLRKSITSVCTKTKTALQRHEFQVRKLKIALQHKNSELKQLNREAIEASKQKNNLAKENQELKKKVIVYDELYQEYTKQNAALQMDNDNLNASVTYVESLVNETEPIEFMDSEKNAYSNSLVECAINLTNLKVATRNVGPVFKVVAKFCGKNVKNIPSRQVIDTFVDRKLAITQKHVGIAAAASSYTTLYTDETRKHGHTYETYIISDDKQNSYILGLREMANKSKITNTNVASKVCLTKSYQLKRSDKEKRGNVKEQYRQQTLSLPTETASSNTSQLKTDAKNGGIKLDKAEHLQKNVATRNVGPVFKEVAKLCGNNVKNIPSRHVIDTFVDRKLAITQTHVEIAAAALSNTTLYTDETRKHGHTYET
ncbi:LOW QUALITY PROTEIN: hypothetical protein MAR_021369 [Mya arenaria]|uniref:Uncharacterized protein n=1 Tax=Mya arenaria TaxID=6604 RepID=A0ABY7E804_MYAAR|nr:LOW QUALITY PROTEIN: hypothetical protein MAR_021369 [Mya arenaria]